MPCQETRPDPHPSLSVYSREPRSPAAPLTFLIPACGLRKSQLLMGHACQHHAAGDTWRSVPWLHVQGWKASDWRLSADLLSERPVQDWVPWGWQASDWRLSADLLSERAVQEWVPWGWQASDGRLSGDLLPERRPAHRPYLPQRCRLCQAQRLRWGGVILHNKLLFWEGRCLGTGCGCWGGEASADAKLAELSLQTTGPWDRFKAGTSPASCSSFKSRARALSSGTPFPWVKNSDATRSPSYACVSASAPQYACLLPHALNNAS